jgi:hypothetical protein
MQVEELLEKECTSGAVALLFKVPETNRRAFIQMMIKVLKGNSLK